MTDLMRETCLTGCGRSWGVTMTPREQVLCMECARPRPWHRPAAYWLSRLQLLPWPSPSDVVAYRDAQTSRADLRVALAAAEVPGG